MKRCKAVFLALILIFSCISAVNVSAVNEVTAEEIQIAVSDYVEEWVQDTYSDHYDMSNFEVSFFSTTINSNQYETYGTVSYSASLAYDTVDDMPLVKGAQDILGITSMESTLKSKSLESTSLDLSTVQTYGLNYQINDYFAELQSYIGTPTIDTFFFKAVGSLTSTPIEVQLFFEQAEEGYISAENFAALSDTELFDKGQNIAETMIAKSEEIGRKVSARGYSEYLRTLAKDYALRYSNNPTTNCHDNTLLLSNGDGCDYDSWNESYYPYQSGFCHDDCADFVSQAIHSGELPSEFTTDGWYRSGSTFTNAWVRVSYLIPWLTNKGYAEECTRDECTAGNIMLTSSTHVVMVTYNDGEKVKFTGHTNDRRDVVISDSKDLTYYLIK